MINRAASQPSAPNITDSWRRRLEALFNSPDMYTDQKFHIMNPWIENRVGSVALLKKLGAADAAPGAPLITAATLPPPKLLFSALKCEKKSPWLPMSSTMNAMSVPAIAMMKE